MNITPHVVSSALAIATAFAANAQEQTAPQGPEIRPAQPLGNEVAADPDPLIRTRDMTGGAVYTTTSAHDRGWHVNDYWEDVDSSWTQVGHVEDLILSQDGTLTGVVVEVGGFFDIGDSHVLLSTDDVNLVGFDDGEYGYVTHLTEAELQALVDVDEGFWN